MMSRINYSSGAVWEDIVGYSRAVKVGNIIEVTGTVAVDENNKAIGIGDAYLQTRFILEKIEKCCTHQDVCNRYKQLATIW
jgi:enamine deaminase RidA (YjgF/YER057c/UK114 family)